MTSCASPGTSTTAFAVAPPSKIRGRGDAEAPVRLTCGVWCTVYARPRTSSPPGTRLTARWMGEAGLLPRITTQWCSVLRSVVSPCLPLPVRAAGNRPQSVLGKTLVSGPANAQACYLALLVDGMGMHRTQNRSSAKTREVPQDRPSPCPGTRAQRTRTEGGHALRLGKRSASGG